MKIVKKIRIRTLPEDYSYNNDFANFISPRPNKFIVPQDWCVLTASSKNHFVGFQLLYSSLFITHRVQIVLFNLGLTDKQLNWCKKQKRLIVLNYFNTHINTHYWEAWHKPMYIMQCPFKKIIWIDSDAVFKGNLNYIIHMAESNPFFTSDHSEDPTITFNTSQLYKYMPINGFKEDTHPCLNTGLFVIDKIRDKTLLQEWGYIVTEALYSSQIQDNISCWDQGACKWVLQNLGLIHCINPNMAFNQPALDRQQLYPAVKEAVLQLFYNIMQLKDAFLVHWMGSDNGRKPWHYWGETLNLDYSL